MNKVRVVWTVIMTLALGSSRALAVNPAHVNHVTLHDYETYHIQVGGQFTYEDDVTDQVTTSQGIGEIGEKRIPFRSPMQRLEILSAYTETPQGEKIPVGPKGIKVQESPVSLAAPTFSDVKIESIIFPRVEVGSKLYFKYRLTQLQPDFPGQFSVADFMAPHSQNDDARLSVIAPAGMKLRIDVTGYGGGKIDCPSGGSDQQCYLWKDKNLITHPPEQGAVAWFDYSPHVVISTFQNYQALASAYEARAADKSKVTPAVQSLANSIVAGTKGDQQRAEVLYNWVANNIRYVALSLGAGSVVPHSAAEVLNHRYGDCKDHVALLESLLAAVGIESTGALVNGSDSYKLTPVPEFQSFNHIITYIPVLHRYVDSTVQFAPFGVLPDSELGKTVLRVKPIPGKDPLDVLSQHDTPATVMDTDATMSIDADGTVSGHAKIVNSGFTGILTRAIFARLPPAQESTVASKILSTEGEPGSGSFEHGDPHDLSVPFSYQTQFTIPHLITMHGPGAFTIPEGLGNLADVRSFTNGFSLGKRLFPVADCVNFRLRNWYQIQIPMQMHVTALPHAIDVAEGNSNYHSSYALSGHTLTVTRKLSIAGRSGVCTPSQYDQLRVLAMAIGRDLRSQVLYH